MNGWDEWLPYVVQAYNSSVSAATRLAPDEIHLGCLPRLTMAIIEGHMGKKQDQLLYLDIVREGNNAPSNSCRRVIS